MKIMTTNSKPWRIAVITPRFTLVGGGERYCVETCRHLAQEPEIELTVICEELIDPLPGVRFIEIGRRDFPRFLKKGRFAKRVRAVMAREGFDLVHSHQQVPGAHVCSLHGTPHQTWVTQVKGKRRASPFDRRLVALEREMLLHPDCRAVLPVSSLVQAAYEEVYDFSEKQIHLAPPAVDEQWLAGSVPGKADRQAVRDRLGFSGTDFVVCFVSMNWPHKGLDLLIRVLGKLNQDTGSKAKLLVVGKGDEPTYAQRAKRAGVDIVFAGIVREGMFDLYAASDVFALPSKWDAFAMVVTEAMTASLPALISDCTGARDIVVDGENGYVIGLENEEAWCGALAGLMRDEPLRKRMGSAARKTAATLSWKRTADSFVEMYRKLLES
ncbi:MAG: glycosyltransferase family 4 protein [Verrucomicrobiota bacterium]|nr:glycosyltransferase family 4 protein [Verrucomicrobiota bacterium]